MTDLLEFDADYFIENIIYYYYDKCSLDVKKKTEEFILKKLNTKFDYSFYLYSVEKNMSFSFNSIYIKNLERFMDEKYLDSQGKTNKERNVFIDTFRTVFFVNYVKHTLPFVSKYLHKISKEIDFLIEQGTFDFKYFDVHWLTYYRTPIQLKLLASNEQVKNKIRDKIIEWLGHNSDQNMKKFLINVLTEYFK